MANWIQTHAGHAFDPFAPDQDKICIKDIAHALSNICRFTGHTNQYYSVAQHCVEVATRVPMVYQPWALLHDASEAYLCDIARPLKQKPEFKFYRDAEDVLQTAIYKRFGLVEGATPFATDIVKNMDLRVLLLEKRLLLGRCEKEWDDHSLAHVEPAMHRVSWRPLSALAAEREFLNCYYLMFEGAAEGHLG
ncbi:hypothetical protein ACFQT0_19645 [Hymenobacter humi]|uniref:Phosphohydrolase n=1 Tax=Hymenobacter humi TaxID=1411620 RepID=A0ABW2U744_9BACT